MDITKETDKIFKKHSVVPNFGKYGMLPNTLESDLFNRVIDLESQIQEKQKEIDKTLLDFANWRDEYEVWIDKNCYGNKDVIMAFHEYLMNKSK